MRLYALFRLAFAPATHHWLTLPHTVTRRLILQKARHRGQTRKSDDALTGSQLRSEELTVPRDLQALGRRHSVYSALRLRTLLCFW